MWSLASEQYLFGVDVFEKADEGASTLADTLEELEKLPAEMSGTQLMGALRASLRRYRITGDVQNTSDAIQTSVEALGDAVRGRQRDDPLHHLGDPVDRVRRHGAGDRGGRSRRPTRRWPATSRA